VPLRRGFSLLELLVVVGVIAVLLSVLLPVLSDVRQRGRAIQCQANLRTSLQLFFAYAAENRGSLPYGWYYNRSDPRTWEDAGGDGRLTTCFSQISKLASKHYRGDDVFLQKGASVNPEDVRANNAPFLKCPEAIQVLPHVCSYVVQYTAFITPYNERELVSWPRPIQDKPAKLRDLYTFTILIHDTAVVPGMSQDVGYVTDADVDLQRMWHGAIHPQWRYYDISDPYSRIVPGIYGNNRRVMFDIAWRNIDPPPIGPEGFNDYPYQGNLRFRHGGNTTCNVGFADGRIEAVRAQLAPDGRIVRHEVLRKSFMIKWPQGMGLSRDPGVP
jgi:prepilin-type N-terminal cleavage/methylation domain-containing protein/prepilin-type processing-associated H-X9-DG protein